MFSTVAALIASTVLAAAALGLWLLRTDDPVAGSAILAASRLALSMAAAIAAVTQVVHLTALSHDSIQYLTTASVLERLGSLDPVPSIELLKRQLRRTAPAHRGHGHRPGVRGVLDTSHRGGHRRGDRVVRQRPARGSEHAEALPGRSGGRWSCFSPHCEPIPQVGVPGQRAHAGRRVGHRRYWYDVAGRDEQSNECLRHRRGIARAHRDHATGWASGPLAAGRACGWRDIALVRGGTPPRG